MDDLVTRLGALRAAPESRFATVTGWRLTETDAGPDGAHTRYVWSPPSASDRRDPDAERTARGQSREAYTADAVDRMMDLLLAYLDGPELVDRLAAKLRQVSSQGDPGVSPTAG